MRIVLSLKFLSLLFNCWWIIEGKVLWKMKIGFTDVDAAVVAVSRDIVLIPLTVFVALAAVADAVVVALVVVVALAVVVTPAVVVESLFLHLPLTNVQLL